MGWLHFKNIGFSKALSFMLQRSGQKILPLFPAILNIPYCSMLVWPDSSKLGHGISKMVRHVSRLSHCTVEHLLDILIH